MISLQDLQLKNEWWINRQFKTEESNWPKRDLYQEVVKNLDHPLMLNIIGLRRVGKSTILKQIINHLLEQKTDPSRVFYFVFDYASQLQKPEYLEQVLSLYFGEVLKKPSVNLEEKIFVFLDEIQYIKNWQAVLKKYYDLSGKRIKFIATGSQSLLLKGKQKESLAGRIFDFYLPPLSFSEFLRINDEKIAFLRRFDLFELPKYFSDLSLYNSYHGKGVAELSKEYILTGQFPESRQFARIEQRQEYILESVLGKVLEDCIRIFGIEKTDEFKLIAFQLLANIGSIFELKNIGREIAVSKITMEKYLEYLKDSYVVETLYRYHKSFIRRGRTLKKVYAPCVNFNAALNHYRVNHIDEIPQAFGKIVENAVYNVLASAYKKNQLENALCFWRQREKEIDFLVTKDAGTLPIEVKFKKSIDFKDVSVMADYVKMKKTEYGIIVSRERLEKREIDGQILYLVPYYLVLLMNQL